MGININLENIKAGGSVKFMNDSSVNGSTEVNVNLNNINLQKDLEFLSNTKIADAINDAEKSLSPDSKEYQALEKIKRIKAADSTSIRNAVLNHIASFATGTLANVLAGYITMK